MTIVDRGVVNPGVRGTSRAVCSFPSLCPQEDGPLLAFYRTGSTKDSADETIEVRVSSDGGASWGDPERPFETTLAGRRGSWKVAYATALSSTHLLAAALWVDREAYPGQPLFHPETQGCLPMRVAVCDSYDGGATWTAWRAVETPAEVGPPSLTNPVLRLPDGRLILSIESNKHYYDAGPWRQFVTYLYSDDEGRNWGHPTQVAGDPQGRYFHWDQRAAVDADGRIISFTWLYDAAADEYREIQRRISADGGRTWSEPAALGFRDQPSHPAILPDGRVVLAWVDRFQSRSIRTRAAASGRDPFPPETEVVLYEAWQTEGTSLTEMISWTYGLPYAAALSRAEAMVLYYAGDAGCTDIHWARLRCA